MAKENVCRTQRPVEAKRSEPHTCEGYVDAIFKLLHSGLEAWALAEKAAGGMYVPAELRRNHVLNSLAKPVRSGRERARFKRRLRTLYQKLVQR